MPFIVKYSILCWLAPEASFESAIVDGMFAIVWAEMRCVSELEYRARHETALLYFVL